MDTQPKKTIFDGMQKYTKTTLADIPLEGGRNQVEMSQVLSAERKPMASHFEAMTKGYLEIGSSYDWHTHATSDEMFIVLQGQGKFYWKEELMNYQEGDVFTIPANTIHKITAAGDKPSEFYFVRVKI